VVIGASISGLLAARVLADHFERVTLLERDHLPAGAAPRRGVPQAQHTHGLLARGAQILAQLFPGLFEEITAAGSEIIQLATDLAWFHHGYWKLRLPIAGLQGHAQSRALLETAIRRRVLLLPNVCLLDACAATGLVADTDSRRVRGVRFTHSNGQQDTLAGDLVVDATGRGSRTARWLEALGYPGVKETVVGMDLAYLSRIFKRPAMSSIQWKAILIYGKAPTYTRLAALGPIEGERWLVTLAGYLGDHPAGAGEGFLSFAQGLEKPDIYQAIKDVEPLTPPAAYKIPSNLWRRFGRMRRFPDGLVIVGDAVCSFNPIYAQGMTTAALEAMCLDTSLRRQRTARGRGNLTGFSRPFQRRLERIILIPWLLATLEDLRYPEVKGSRFPGLSLIHWYTGCIHALSASDPYVMTAFAHVVQMEAHPLTLLDPRVVARVIRASLRPWRPGATPPRRGTRQSPQ
jgi:2-polyprenyl-6-methoxyphenol hydroxylase-like FAD-dependent oxidoreductase